MAIPGLYLKRTSTSRRRHIPMHIPLDQLHPHPMNSNVMPADRRAKLARHIEATGHYPPLIVRPWRASEPDGATTDEPAYQLLDGHHRAAVLRELGHDTAQCEVWEVDDDQALMLLATLNRLNGADDPHRRAALLDQLAARNRQGASDLARWLPETRRQLKRYRDLQECAPPRPPKNPDDLPRAVTFFLTAADRDRLETTLAARDTDRNRALMALLDEVASH